MTARDLIYGRQGGRVIPAGKQQTGPVWLCELCGGPMRDGQPVRHAACCADTGRHRPDPRCPACQLTWKVPARTQPAAPWQR